VLGSSVEVVTALLDSLLGRRLRVPSRTGDGALLAGAGAAVAAAAVAAFGLNFGSAEPAMAAGATKRTGLTLAGTFNVGPPDWTDVSSATEGSLSVVDAVVDCDERDDARPDPAEGRSPAPAPAPVPVPAPSPAAVGSPLLMPVGRLMRLILVAVLVGPPPNSFGGAIADAAAFPVELVFGLPLRTSESALPTVRVRLRLATLCSRAAISSRGQEEEAGLGRKTNSVGAEIQHDPRLSAWHMTTEPVDPTLYFA